MIDLYGLFLVETDPNNGAPSVRRVAGPLPQLRALRAAKWAAPALPVFLFVPGRPPHARPPFLLLAALLPVVGISGPLPADLTN